VRPSERLFTHLHVELSVAARYNVPRWSLWLYLSGRGYNPCDLQHRDAVRFMEQHARDFLRGWKLASNLPPELVQRATASVRQFNPGVQTPEEMVLRLTSGASGGE
jgi:hypothetical protein